MLLVFSGITLPFFQKTRRDAGRKEFNILHYLFLPIPLSIAALTVNSIVNLGSWGIIYYLLLYIFGFYFFARESLRVFVRKIGILAGGLSILFTAIYLSWVIFYGFPMTAGMSWGVFMIVRVLLVWNTMFFILYLGDQFLNMSNRALAYASEASMPFYVLHQPIIILIGYLIYNLAWPVPVKLIIVVSSSFAIIMWMYHFMIRRVNILRVLFGLKGNKEMNSEKGMDDTIKVSG